MTKVLPKWPKDGKTALKIVVIGHKGHPEVEGTLGQADSGMYLINDLNDIATLQVENPEKLAYVSQTTLSVDDTAEIIHSLKTRFPFIVEPKKRTSVMPQPTGRKRSSCWPKKPA